MENFDWTQFSKRIFVRTDLDLVYNAWTKSTELEKWFLSKARFKSKDGNEILVSENISSKSSYSWNWFAQEHGEKGIIREANGRDYLEFTFAGNCIVKVHLSKIKDQTLVDLSQTEIPTDSSSQENIRLGCAFAWTFYLLNLKSVLEGGLDLRNKDLDLKGVINN
tara:strand:+ start:9459 stop:9953 length:495 start_codon:yes stop_codon:yes gene_type:complete